MMRRPLLLLGSLLLVACEAPVGETPSLCADSDPAEPTADDAMEIPLGTSFHVACPDAPDLFVTTVPAEAMRARIEVTFESGRHPLGMELTDQEGERLDYRDPDNNGDRGNSRAGSDRLFCYYPHNYGPDRTPPAGTPIYLELYAPEGDVEYILAFDWLECGGTAE